MFINIILPIILIIIAIVFSVFLSLTIKKKVGKDKGFVTKNEPKTMSLMLKKEYCSEKEMQFLEALHKALPKECIGFPKVGVDNLVTPKDNLVDYKNILSKYVDICVYFRNGMQPILVIDLVESNPIQQQLKKMDSNVVKALNTVSIPIIKVQIQEEYDLLLLRNQLINAMPSRAVAYLKEQMLNDK